MKFLIKVLIATLLYLLSLLGLLKLFLKIPGAKNLLYDLVVEITHKYIYGKPPTWRSSFSSPIGRHGTYQSKKSS